MLHYLNRLRLCRHRAFASGGDWARSYVASRDSHHDTLKNKYQYLRSLTARALIQIPHRSGQVCFNFGSLASYWPRPWNDFGMPWGREASQMRSGDFQESTRDDPNRLLGVPLGVGSPEGDREPQGDNPGDPKEASRRRGAQVLIYTKKG